MTVLETRHYLVGYTIKKVYRRAPTKAMEGGTGSRNLVETAVLVEVSADTLDFYDVPQEIQRKYDPKGRLSDVELAPHMKPYLLKYFDWDRKAAEIVFLELQTLTYIMSEGAKDALYHFEIDWVRKTDETLK